MPSSLEPPDSHVFSAACGWLELGNLREAELELKKLAKSARKHPDVLEFLWAIHSRKDEWDDAARVAEELKRQAPDRASGWLHHSYALRRSSGGGLAASRDALRPAYELFPDEPVVPYNLACYACQLDCLDEAREWFSKALKAEEQQTARTVGLLLESVKPDSRVTSMSGIKKMALRDEDLKPLWSEIEKL